MTADWPQPPLAACLAVVAPAPQAPESAAYTLIAWAIVGLGAGVVAWLAWKTIREPSWLNRLRRSSGVQPLLAAALLCVYLALPYMLRQVMAGVVGAAPEPMTLEYMTRYMWVGYAAVGLPVVGLFGLVLIASRNDERLEKRRPMSPGRAAAVSLVVFVGVGLVTAAVQAAMVALRQAAGYETTQIAHETLRLLAGASLTNPWTQLAILGAVVAAPWVEEVVYRGTIQGPIRTITGSPWAGIAVGSVVFAFMHMGIAQAWTLPAYFVVGVGFGLAYEITGRISAAVLVHALFNAANLAMVFAVRTAV